MALKDERSVPKNCPMNPEWFRASSGRSSGRQAESLADRLGDHPGRDCILTDGVESRSGRRPFQTESDSRAASPTCTAAHALRPSPTYTEVPVRLATSAM